MSRQLWWGHRVPAYTVALTALPHDAATALAAAASSGSHPRVCTVEGRVWVVAHSTSEAVECIDKVRRGSSRQRDCLCWQCTLCACLLAAWRHSRGVCRVCFLVVCTGTGVSWRRRTQ